MKFYLWHRFAYKIIIAVLTPLTRLVMGYSRVRQSGPDEPSIVIANHNGEYDAALVGVAFRRHMYFVSSEHVLRLKNRLASFAIRHVANPIPINKTHTDIASIKETLRRVKAGASVCIFAEGDRSSFGTTEQIPPSTAKLVKSSGAQLITFRIEGGYFATPLWAKSKRKGKITGRMVGRYPAGELKSMTNEQVLGIIERDIYENASERQKTLNIRYKGEDLAENIELVLYLCPECGAIGSIKSEGGRFWCPCGLEAEYTETGMFEGEKLRFKTIDEWGRWQTAELAETVRKAGGGTICSDEGQSLYFTYPTKGIELVGKGPMSIDREAFHCAGERFPLSGVTRFAIAGSMTLLFSSKEGASYEVHSDTPRSALKYKEIFRILSES